MRVLVTLWLARLVTWPIRVGYRGADAIACISRTIEHETLEAGVQVYPHLYRDRRTRLFIYSTSNDYGTAGRAHRIASTSR